ncbi:uncharacterized protein BP5553_06582 [Venustampulla echinocandica]|uniref:Uncharacterized protein n=1 Tax=Venustampulla echinocandica TaxID=2656787 RepID=A0A370TKC0_9HELO|nr:uncharacterized protein BP5553_06582 [Venustampulla echinocandica]RDL35970.1 hypothetical protein BP5553_06582 [Venustampulla echinocandica]
MAKLAEEKGAKIIISSAGEIEYTAVKPECSEEVLVGRTTTLDLAEVYTLGVVELDAEVGDGPEVETKVLVDVEDEAGFLIEADVEVNAEVDVRVNVEVKPIVPPPVVIAPPGPAQILPLGQQPYSLFVPRMQYFVGGQPAARLGQQVQVVSMHLPALVRARKESGLTAEEHEGRITCDSN